MPQISLENKTVASPAVPEFAFLREGRRNVYSVRTHLPLGLPIQRDIDIGSLLAIVFAQDDSTDAAA